MTVTIVETKGICKRTEMINVKQVGYVITPAIPEFNMDQRIVLSVSFNNAVKMLELSDSCVMTIRED